MKKITYMNDYTFEGRVIDENELTYTFEFEASSGFFDTITFEKEYIVMEELNSNGLTTIVDYRREGISYTGLVVKGRTYDYIVFEHDMSPNTITVKKIRKDKKGLTSIYYWDIKKDTLKGSGGLSKKVMDIVKSLI